MLSAVSACAAAAVRLLTPTGWTGSGFHAPLACQIFLLGELAMREKVIFRCGLLQPSPGGAASGRSRCSPSDGHIFAPRSPPEPSDGAPESSECALDAPYLQRRRALRTKELKRTLQAMVSHNGGGGAWSLARQECAQRRAERQGTRLPCPLNAPARLLRSIWRFETSADEIILASPGPPKPPGGPWSRVTRSEISRRGPARWRIDCHRVPSRVW